AAGLCRMCDLGVVGQEGWVVPCSSGTERRTCKPLGLECRAVRKQADVRLSQYLESVPPLLGIALSQSADRLRGMCLLYALLLIKVACCASLCSPSVPLPAWR